MTSVPVHKFKCKCHLNNNGCDATPSQWKRGELEVVIQMLSVNNNITYQFRIKSTETKVISGITNVIYGIDGKISVEYANQSLKSYLFLSNVCKEDYDQIQSIFNKSNKRKSDNPVNSISTKRSKRIQYMRLLPKYLFKYLLQFLNPTYAFNRYTDQIICSQVKSIKILLNKLNKCELIKAIERHPNLETLTYSGIFPTKAKLTKLQHLNIGKATIAAEDMNRLLLSNPCIRTLEITEVNEQNIKGLASLKQLEELNVKNSANLELISIISTLKKLHVPMINQFISLFSNLRLLNIFSFGESDGESKTMDILTRLNIPNISMHTSSDYKSVISEKLANSMSTFESSLKTIDFAWIINSQYIEHFCHSEGSKTITKLVFHSLSVKNSDIVMLLEECEVLQDLDITYCGALTEFCIESHNILSPLKKLCHSIEFFNRDPTRLGNIFDSIEVVYKAIKPKQFA